MARVKKVVSLFTGLGGIDIGLEKAGYKTVLCVENDKECQETLALNRPFWKLANPSDVFELTGEIVLAQAGLKPKQADLLAGGPPCQPFSKAGYWVSGDSKRMSDPRAGTINSYLEIVGAVLPKALLFENVKGFAFKEKDEGLKILCRGLERINETHGTKYRAHILRINAIDYGVPQRRERIFIIASRDGKDFQLPQPTHGAEEALLPVATAWDAIGDLSDNVHCDLSVTGKWSGLLPTIPEGENYLWHTRRGGGVPLFGWRTRYWSFLLKLAKNQPSWTIPANPGPAVGPFHWDNRKLSVRELCRIQTIPDEWHVSGEYRAARRQIGNAVPPALSYLLGLWIRKQFFNERVRTVSMFTPESRKTPRATRELPVPKQFLNLIGNHNDHPGEGLGPRAIKRANEGVK